MPNLEKDVESLLKFAKVAEFKYRLFTKEEGEATAEANAPESELAPPQERALVTKMMQASASPVVQPIKPVEASNPGPVPKKSLAEKFALLASQPPRTGSKPILKKDSFSKRALPVKQNATATTPTEKPLIAVFARLDSDQNSAKKRLYLTK